MADQAAQTLHDRRALTVTLIVVSGAPSTGKSTTAAALGAALRFPVLSLDPIKEALADVLGLGGEDWSNQVGDAAAEVVFRLAAAFPDAVAEVFCRPAELAATVAPPRLGAGLIEVDTGAPGAAESAVTAVRSALSL